MAPPVRKSSESFDEAVVFAGGRLCLDFVNTLCENRGAPLEFLADPAALRRWLRAAESRHGRVEGESWSEWIEEKSLARTHAFRNTLRDLVHGALEGRPPSEAALEAVNAVLQEAPTRERLEFSEGAFRQATFAVPTSEPWLAAIAQDAVDFLCRADLSLLRQCGCETCVRVFYDTTKNHRRRWCVEKCGSRIKAANYYRRKRLRAQPEREA